MLTWLLIIFVLALALAPLAHFVPSKRQRQVARMREAAALGGLFVEFREAPKGARVPAGGSVIYYGQRFPAAMSERPVRAAWWRDGERWLSAPPGVAPPPALAKVPAAVIAAGVDGASCGVYWTEDAEEEAVAVIREALQQWQAELSGHAG